MPRPASGSVRWNTTAKRWEVRVTLSSGARSRPIAMTGLPACGVAADDPPRGCACDPCEGAREAGRGVSQRMRDGAHVDVATEETANEWRTRADAYERECGRTDPTKRTRWNKWIAPRIGTKTPASVTRDDVEDIRDALDKAIRSGEITGKTAMNVWSALTSSFKAMASSKRRDLRVRTDNPCLGVEPPGDRHSRKTRRKPFVFPRECAALLGCAAVPLEWREAHAIAAYTYLRPGELRVLTWADVDLDASVINITKAWDYAEETIKEPKTRNGVRRVPIEPALAPLLRRMREGRRADDLVLPILSLGADVTSSGRRASVDHLAVLFRDHLRAAGVERAELHVSTRTHVQANFRSWRDSGVTWLAMTGLGVDKIMRRAGHDMVQTTMGYVKQAEDLTGDLGVPFGPLPPSLVAAASDDLGAPGGGFGGVLVNRSGGPKIPRPYRAGEGI